MNGNIELLAPAGNEAALCAAVQSGADAVYIGGRSFGARASAQNFSVEDIKKYADYCHLYGVDLHVTVNTLVKEKELEALKEYVCALNDARVDALIVQDVGVAEFIHRLIPDMPIHASTQMTVTSLEGVKYLENMGFSRVVLARELSKSEIEKICKGAKAEIEVFAHGAICMCYSGQCLMSSVLGGRSGNRGRCAQPCRLKYDLMENSRTVGSAYILSPRDMALVKHLNELRDIGVKSLKIEGRLKRAEYVSTVVGVYRKYLDTVQDVLKEDMRELHNAFSRTGFTDGYFTGKLGEQMMSHKNPGNTNNTFTSEAKQRAVQGANIRKIPVNISGKLHIGEPIEVSVFDNDGNFALAAGDMTVETAVNKPMAEERFVAQLSKTGSTPFEAENVYADVDTNASVAVREINNVRREALERLAQQRMSREIRKVVDLSAGKCSQVKRKEIKFSAEVRTLEQGREAAKRGIELIYAPFDVVCVLEKEYPKITSVTRTEDIFAPQKTNNNIAVSSNAALYYYGKKDVRLYGTHRLNVFNSLSLEHYSNLELVTISPELNLGEIKAISMRSNIKFEVIGYGAIGLMLMRNCPIKAMGRCQKKRDIYTLKDRMNEEFPIICHENCIAELLNSKPIFMADKLEDLAATGAEYVKLIFTTETPHQCGRVIDIYKDALEGNITKMRENTFTRGHYYRGVE